MKEKGRRSTAVEHFTCQIDFLSLSNHAKLKTAIST